AGRSAIPARAGSVHIKGRPTLTNLMGSSHFPFREPTSETTSKPAKSPHPICYSKNRETKQPHPRSQKATSPVPFPVCRIEQCSRRSFSFKKSCSSLQPANQRKEMERQRWLF